MSKLTKLQIKEIQELYKQGKNTYELAKEFNISQNSIVYWVSNRDKQIKRSKEYVSNLTKEQRHLRYLKRKEYQKVYFMNRYNTNPEFREKVKARAREYKRRKK
jgi:hypothetical protein